MHCISNFLRSFCENRSLAIIEWRDLTIFSPRCYHLFINCNRHHYYNGHLFCICNLQNQKDDLKVQWKKQYRHENPFCSHYKFNLEYWCWGGTNGVFLTSFYANCFILDILRSYLDLYHMLHYCLNLGLLYLLEYCKSKETNREKQLRRSSDWTIWWLCWPPKENLALVHARSRRHSNNLRPI